MGRRRTFREAAASSLRAARAAVGKDGCVSVGDLVSSLGSVRRKLLGVLSVLTDESVNSTSVAGRAYTVADIALHIRDYEISVADRILGALSAPPADGDDPTVPELAGMVARYDEPVRTAGRHIGVDVLVDLLEDARFGRLQRVFNEARIVDLAARRMPVFGVVSVSLKAAIDTVWIHELRHTDEIASIAGAPRSRDTSEMRDIR